MKCMAECFGNSLLFCFRRNAAKHERHAFFVAKVFIHET